MHHPVYIRDIMVKPVTIAKSQAITVALDKMIDEGIDPLIVLSGHDVVGTVSRKSIADRLAERQRGNIATAKIHVAGSVEKDFTTVTSEQEISVLPPLLKRSKLVVVYDKNGHLVGQVGYGELLKVLQPKGNTAMVMEPAPTISVDERLQHLQNRMSESGISRFIVMESSRPVGIVTETDVAVSLRKFREKIEGRHQDFHLHNLLVRSVMTSPVLTIDLSVTIAEIVNLMLTRKISSIPVSDRGKIAGMVTRRSLVNRL